MKRNDPPPVREYSPDALDAWKRYIERRKANVVLHRFEEAVKGLEALCLQHAPERSMTTTPERFSDGWYASEILFFIRCTRFNLEKGHPNHAATDALSAGVLAGAWPGAQQWREQQEARRRGGRAPKHLSGLQAVVDRLVIDNPKATARELWDKIPEEDADTVIYRDGSKVVQMDDTTGREKAIKTHSPVDSDARRAYAMAQSDSISRLAPRQLVALECLMTREVDETIEQIAERAGVSRRTMHRYLRDASFHAEYKSRVIMEIGSQRGRMALALVKGGTTPGPGQAAMQKIYWTMLGELKELSAMELTGKDGGPIETDEFSKPIPADALSLHVKKLILFELSSGQLSEKLVDGIMKEVDDAQLEI